MERLMEAGWRGSGNPYSSGDSPSYPSPARVEISTDFPGPLQRTPGSWEVSREWTWSPSLKRIVPLVTGNSWLRLGSRFLQGEALRFQAKPGRPRAGRFYRGRKAGGDLAPSVSRGTEVDDRGCSWAEALGCWHPCLQG